MTTCQTSKLPAGPLAASVKAPLFIPLKAKFYDAFEDGSKDTEYRQSGPRWNLDTCQIGRRVILSRGYGTQARLTGVIVGFHFDHLPGRIPGFRECYPSGGVAACIKIKLDKFNKLP